MFIISYLLQLILTCQSNAPGLCPGHLQSQTSQTWPQTEAPILPRPLCYGTQGTEQGHFHREQVGCELLCSSPWSYPGPVQRVFPKHVPHALCPGHLQGHAPALRHLCHRKALEMEAWHRECVWVDTNTSIRAEMKWRKGSCPQLCMGRGSRERVSNAQH